MGRPGTRARASSSPPAMPYTSAKFRGRARRIQIPAKEGSLTPDPPSSLWLKPERSNAMTSAKRKVEVFSAGCTLCEEVITLVKQIASPSCEITILDMKDPAVVARAKALGVRTVPAVAIDGVPTDGCSAATLYAVGLGRPI